MQHDTVQRRSLVERIFHAVCFEGIATAILAPTTAWLMQRSVLEMGGLTILLATTAMIWNIIYNALFDRLWPSHLVKRTAYVLNVSLFQAFTLEIGFFLFFLPYTMFYNWAYDTLRERVMKRRQQRVTA